MNEPITWHDYLMLELGIPLILFVVAMLAIGICLAYVSASGFFWGRSRRKFEKMMRDLEDE